uniref:Uncharacterized protein n=1 Tax=viral metagenome TaxID=1070528 RepID=A0A6C0FCF2_9ZZZZ
MYQHDVFINNTPVSSRCTSALSSSNSSSSTCSLNSSDTIYSWGKEQCGILHQDSWDQFCDNIVYWIRKMWCFGFKSE